MVSITTSLYFKTHEEKKGTSEIIKPNNSPAYNLSQKNVNFTIKDIYNEILNSRK